MNYAETFQMVLGNIEKGAFTISSIINLPEDNGECIELLHASAKDIIKFRTAWDASNKARGMSPETTAAGNREKAASIIFQNAVNKLAAMGVPVEDIMKEVSAE